MTAIDKVRRAYDVLNRKAFGPAPVPATSLTVEFHALKAAIDALPARKTARRGKGRRDG